MIKKTEYEEFFRYHDFTAWLNDDEEIVQASVKVYNNEVEKDDMISDVAAYDKKKVRYRLMGGEAGTQYKIRIQITTSNQQKFEDAVDLLVLWAV